MAIRAPGQYATRRTTKKGRSHSKENRFLKKRFFSLTTSTPFPVSFHGKTSVTRMRAKQNLVPSLLGRTFSVNQGDLNGENKETHRNFDFKIGKVIGTNCVGFFNGMCLARDRMTAMIKKWHTLVEAETPIETRDGSTWRVFVSAVTRRLPGQTKKATYLKSSQEREIRKIMIRVVKEELDGLDVEKVIQKLSSEALGKLVEAQCADIHPLTAVVRKVKPIQNARVAEGIAAQRSGPQEDAQVELLAEN